METKNMLCCPECNTTLSPLGFFNGVYKDRKCPNPQCEKIFNVSNDMFEGAMNILYERITIWKIDDYSRHNKWENKAVEMGHDICVYVEIGMAYAKFKYLMMWCDSLKNQAVDKEGMKSFFEFGRKLTIERRKAWLRLSRQLHQREHSGCIWELWSKKTN